MAERDRFDLDLDLRAALRAFAEDAPTDVRPAELARRFALEHPRGRTVVPPWRPALLPRLAWLLLLVGLLVALGGGALIIGSRLARSVPAVLPPIGQTFVCPPGSTPDEPGPVDQARPPEGRYAMAFDRRAGRLVVLAEADNRVETWTFDVCANTWTRMHPNREPPTFEWAQSVYDVDSDVTILVSYQAVWAYDLQADTWSEKGAAPTTNPTFLAYDPTSGLVIANGFGPDEMWTYDVEADTWTPIDQANGPESYGPVVYDTSVDRLVMYAWGPDRAEAWLLDIRTGTWSRSGADTPVISRGWGFPEPPTIAYDEAAERTVVFSGGQMASYDVTTDSWETLAEAEPGGGFPASLAYDAVNRRLVGRSDRSAVEALDPATGEWTELLEPSPIPDDLVANLAAVWRNPYDADSVAALYAPDAVVHDRVENLTQAGLEGIGARIRHLNTEGYMVVVSSAPIRQDDFVAHFVWFGPGVAKFPGLIVYEIKDGKVVNQWMYSTPSPATQPPAAPSPTANPDEAIMDDVAVVWSNPYDAARVAALYATDAVIHDEISGSASATGLEAIQARVKEFAAKPFEVKNTSASIRQGNYVAVFHLYGSPEAAFPGLTVLELKDGKIVSQWMYATE
jgi:ketosteroid isomerase-like protein